ncbi:MAG: flagellar basal body rod modification protein, partial [Rhodobacteraceae bacterium]
MTLVQTLPGNPNTSLVTARQSASGGGALSSDFNTFIRMLTAQARYQDPLEPLDSTQYAAQLAQFSMVEQQVLANDQLSALNASLATGNMAALAGWVGMEARALAPVAYSGQSVTIAPNPAAVADQAILIIADQRGVEMARREIPVSTQPYLWDGRDGAGSVMPYGTYSFAVESRAQGEVILVE